METFDNNEMIYFEVPEVFETLHPSNVLLLFLHTIYWL